MQAKGSTDNSRPAAFDERKLVVAVTNANISESAKSLLLGAREMEG